MPTAGPRPVVSGLAAQLVEVQREPPGPRVPEHKPQGQRQPVRRVELPPGRRRLPERRLGCDAGAKASGRRGLGRGGGQAIGAGPRARKSWLGPWARQEPSGRRARPAPAAACNNTRRPGPQVPGHRPRGHRPADRLNRHRCNGTTGLGGRGGHGHGLGLGDLSLPAVGGTRCGESPLEQERKDDSDRKRPAGK